jgi:hypothetical protein
MYCPNCGTENPSDAKFFYECGTKLLDVINSELDLSNSNSKKQDTNLK